MRTATSLARLWQSQGKRPEDHDLLAPVYEWFTEGLDTADLQEAKGLGYPRKTGQLKDSHRDLKCRKARPRWLRIQKPEALMLQSVPPYVDTQGLLEELAN